MVRVLIERFKGIERLELELPQVAVLVGANACGKTTVLQAIDAALSARWAAARSLAVPNHVARLYAVGRRRRGEPPTMCVWSGPGAALAQLTTTKQGTIRADGDWPVPLAAFFAPDREHILTTVPLRLQPQMERNGEGLADVLASMGDDKKARILELVRHANPRVTGFALPRSEVMGQVFDEDLGAPVSAVIGTGFELRVTEGPDVLGGEAVSDGTLWAIALATLIESISVDADAIILIDDLDRDLHPRAQYEIARAVRAVVSSRPNLSLLATAHSPFLLNAFAPEEVFVMHRAIDDQVSAKALSTHRDWSKWKGQLDTGEFWSWAQEDWVSGS